MKQILLLLFWATIGPVSLSAQEEVETGKFYLGLSYGTSYSIGNFSDTDINNPDAGFAKNGKKLDIYGGRFLNDRVTLTGTLRYQTYETEVEDLIETYNEENPGDNFSGSTEDWKAYYFLVGVAYKVNLSPRFSFFPRVGLGPLIASNPGMTVFVPNSSVSKNFIRSSETGAGLGYELGIGLRSDLGRHFSLMPTFTFSGGVIRIPDVITTTDNVTVSNDFEPRIQSFNLGLSLAYRFY